MSFFLHIYLLEVNLRRKAVEWRLTNMYNNNNKQFVFKKSSGKIWELSYDKRNGISYSNLTKRNLWTMPISLEKQAKESFSACMDSKDVFHIIYQNSLGNIFYIYLDETSLTSFPMLNSRNPSPYNKYFDIIPLQNNLHCFYILWHDNKYLLTHQVISNKEIKNPQALGYVSKNNLPFTTFTTNTGDIYVFYQTAMSNDLQQKTQSLQVGYKKYSYLDQAWDDFVAIPVTSLKFDYPSLIIDNSSLIHFSYQRVVADHYELVYRQKLIEGNNWSPEVIIHTSLNSFENSSIICIDDRIIIYWVINDVIYYCFSSDKGNSWSKSIKYNFSVGRQLSCISYSSNDLYEVNRILMNEVPGSLINGVKLAFYDDFLNIESPIAAKDDLKNVVTDSLKSLNSNIDDLIEANNSLKTDIKRLKLFNTNIVREIDKLSIKISYLENQVKYQNKNAFVLDIDNDSLASDSESIDDSNSTDDSDSTNDSDANDN